jgi:ATP-binding cassette, subfamily F, member 3
MISLERIQVSFGGFDLLRETSFLIQPDDRIGLIGRNGAGKTTLLKLIAGILQPSSGGINISNDTVVGYLPQEMKTEDSRTLFGETALAFEELLEIEKKISRLIVEIASAPDYHSAEYLKKLDQISDLNERYSLLGGESYRADIEQTLLGLGFERTDFHRPTSEFSGGWRMRVELAKLLLKCPDVVLLDEPTNHLDIEAIQWLEGFLKSYRGAVVLVSHDKAFLDAICTRTLEISLGRITDQKMYYSAFVKWKEEQREVQMAAYRNQQKMIEDTERFIERFRYKATKAVQVQSRIKQLEKIERIEVEEEGHAAIRIKFPPAPRSGRVVVEAKSISKAYGNHLVLDNIDLLIQSGEKVAFVGRNGEGKTTLVRIILQQIGHKGTMKTGHNVKTGYFAQNQAQLLNEELTVYETIDEVAVGEVRTKIRDLLGAFLFSGEDVDKKVKVLSGGEKSRLAMIRLMLDPVNLLVLDEPTNHLDMKSKEILKEALLHFTGTLIVVSHDRDFLNNLVDCVYEFRNKKIKQHLGGIYDFLQKKKMESLKELEMPVKSVPSPKNIRDGGNDQSGGIRYEERKYIKRQISRWERLVSGTEGAIEELESKISEIDRLLSSSGELNDPGIFEKYEALKIELARVMEKWEMEHKELETWKSKKSW